MVRFARWNRRVRVFCRPSASAAVGGNLSLSWLLPRVMPQKYDD
jgi:hypothetical protein